MEHVANFQELSLSEMEEVNGGWVPVVVFVGAFLVGWGVQTYIDYKQEKKVEKQIQDAINRNSVTNSVYGR